MTEELTFPSGIRLIRRWQKGDSAAAARMTELFSAAVDGEFDATFVIPPPEDRVHGRR